MVILLRHSYAMECSVMLIASFSGSHDRGASITLITGEIEINGMPFVALLL
jgi:hypothetical protein